MVVILTPSTAQLSAELLAPGAEVLQGILQGMFPRETVRFVFPEVLMFPETKSYLDSRIILCRLSKYMKK